MDTPTVKLKVDQRIRDLIHYFEDFGGDGQNRRYSLLVKKKIVQITLWVVFFIFAAWFSYQSYLGLLIYDI